MHDGDTVAVEVTGLDRPMVTVSGQGAVACPTRGATSGPKASDQLTPVSERVTTAR